MRLFLAIDFPKEVNDYLFFLQSFFKSSENIHPVSSFHLTLKFFGEYDEKEINNKLDDFHEMKFSLKLDGLGVFPNEKFPKVIWVGVNNVPGLKALSEKINSLFPDFKPDFDFHPHITIARCNTKIVLPEIKINPLTFEVNEFRLYQSILTREGPIYKEIKKISLT